MTHERFIKNTYEWILYGHGKAANTRGVATSGLEMNTRIDQISFAPAYDNSTSLGSELMEEKLVIWKKVV